MTVYQKRRTSCYWAIACLLAARNHDVLPRVQGFQALSIRTMPGMAPAVLPTVTGGTYNQVFSSHPSSLGYSPGTTRRDMAVDNENEMLTNDEEEELPLSFHPPQTIMSANPLEESFEQSFQSSPISFQQEQKSTSPISLTNEQRQQHQQPTEQQPIEQPPQDWYHQTDYQSKRQQRRQWLLRTTDSLMNTPPGTLIKGKWHELASMLFAWSSYTKSDPEAPLRMEAILKRLHDERRAGNQEVQTDIKMYNRLLDAWVCAAVFGPSSSSSLSTTISPVTASQRTREILVLLQETYEAQMAANDANAHLLMPNEESFNLVLYVVCKIEGPTIARRLLALMEYLHRSGKNPLAKPSRTDYTSVLHAYTQPLKRGSKQHQENAGALAEGFLRHMNITAGITPDTYCYNLAIKAWSRAKRGREAAKHADRILEEMQAPKDIVTYASVISAWANSGMKAHAVQRAEELLRQIENDPNLEPNTVVLNAVMSTWVRSRSPGACNRTEELLREMEQATDSQIRPDLRSYNTHLHALSLQAKKPGLAQRADNLLQAMEDRYEQGQVDFAPNLFSYNLVIESWSKSPASDAAIRAAHVLRKLAKVANNSNSGTGPKRPGVEPDTFSFNQVLLALSRSSMKGAAQMAQELLEYMDKAYRTGIHPNARPDANCYISVIRAHTRSGEPGAAVKAEQLLQQMKDRYYGHKETYAKPDRDVYNAVIQCWAKSGSGTLGARKAEALLQEMQELKEKYNDESMAPNIVTFNSVLNAWALSGTRCCGHKAESYLNQMWERYIAGDDVVVPDELTYNTVINAISKSKNEAKAQRALRILRRMDKLYQAGLNKEARPSGVTYTAVLRSCAFPAVPDERTRRKALDTAIFTLEELKTSRYGNPNEITYSTFFKACANLLSDDDDLRRAVIKEVFHQCCKDGQVGELVLTHLRAAAPADLYHELVVKEVQRRKPGRQHVRLSDLPPEWYSRIRPQRKSQPPKSTPRPQNLHNRNS